MPQELDSHDQSLLASFTEHRGMLFSLAYRMLGSVADAEDMLQEAFVRWQGASRDDVRSAKAFLITIVTRLCIDHLNSSRVQREEYVGQWLPEPVVTDTASDPLQLVRPMVSHGVPLLERPKAPDERGLLTADL